MCEEATAFSSVQAPWPHLSTLSQVCRSAGKELLPRLPIYPALASQIEGRSTWLVRT